MLRNFKLYLEAHLVFAIFERLLRLASFKAFLRLCLTSNRRAEWDSNPKPSGDVTRKLPFFLFNSIVRSHQDKNGGFSRATFLFSSTHSKARMRLKNKRHFEYSRIYLFLYAHCKRREKTKEVISSTFSARESLSVLFPACFSFFSCFSFCNNDLKYFDRAFSFYGSFSFYATFLPIPHSCLCILSCAK